MTASEPTEEQLEEEILKQLTPKSSEISIPNLSHLAQTWKYDIQRIIAENKSKEYFDKEISLSKLDQYSEEKLYSLHQIYKIRHTSKIGDLLTKGIVQSLVTGFNSILNIRGYAFDNTDELVEEVSSCTLSISQLKAFCTDICLNNPRVTALVTAALRGANHVVPLAKSELPQAMLNIP